MSSPQPTPIAVAVVRHAGQVLIGQRPPGVPLAGLWEFPGGKALPGETLPMAAARECGEETGLEVQIDDELLTVVHRYEHGLLELHFFSARPRDPWEAPRAPFRWVAVERLRGYAFPPANAALVERLIAGVFGR